MGIKGLIRDVVMFYIGIQLLTGAMNSFTSGILLIVVSIIFTILAWLRYFRG